MFMPLQPPTPTNALLDLLDEARVTVCIDEALAKECEGLISRGAEVHYKLALKDPDIQATPVLLATIGGYPETLRILTTKLLSLPDKSLALFLLQAAQEHGLTAKVANDVQRDKVTTCMPILSDAIRQLNLASWNQSPNFDEPSEPSF